MLAHLAGQFFQLGVGHSLTAAVGDQHTDQGHSTGDHGGQIRGFSKKARLTRSERKNNFKIYLNDGLTKDVAEKYNPTSSKMKIIKKIFAGEHTVLYACLCRAVSFAQNKLGTVYNRILKK